MAEYAIHVPFMARCEAYMLSRKTERSLKTTGQNLSLARRRRQISMLSMAERIGCSVRTLARLESGSGAVSLETFAMYLETLGMLKLFEDLVDSANDGLGIALMDEQVPKRIRRKPAGKASGAL